MATAGIIWPQWDTRDHQCHSRLHQLEDILLVDTLAVDIQWPHSVCQCRKCRLCPDQRSRRHIPLHKRRECNYPTALPRMCYPHRFPIHGMKVHRMRQHPNRPRYHQVLVGRLAGWTIQQRMDRLCTIRIKRKQKPNTNPYLCHLTIDQCIQICNSSM